MEYSDNDRDLHLIGIHENDLVLRHLPHWVQPNWVWVLIVISAGVQLQVLVLTNGAGIVVRIPA